MARQPEIIKIAKSETDKANITAGKIRNYLALCIYAVRDDDKDKFRESYDQLVAEVEDLKRRVGKVFDGRKEG